MQWPFPFHETDLTDINRLWSLHRHYRAYPALVGAMVDQQTKPDAGAEVLWAACPHGTDDLCNSTAHLSTLTKITQPNA